MQVTGKGPLTTVSQDDIPISAIELAVYSPHLAISSPCRPMA